MSKMVEFPTNAIVHDPIEEATKGLKIHPIFRDLLKPLSDEEYKSLEQSIITEGCKHPIEVWNGYIVDGHNRHDICLRQGVDFKIVHRQFLNERDAKFWIGVNQLGRRNLPEEDRLELVSFLREEYEKEARINQGTRTDLINKYEVYVNNLWWVPTSSSLKNLKEEVSLKSEKQKEWDENRVRSKLAKIANVSPDKVFKYEAIKKLGKAEEILEVKEGTKKINPTYEEIKRRHRAEEAKQEFPKEKYRVIYADLYERNLNDPLLGWSMKRPIENLSKIPVREFLDDQAVAFLWTPINFLKRTLDLMTTWGFKYQTMFIGKNGQPFKGNHNSIEHYLLLIGTKLGCLPDIEKRLSSDLTQYLDDKERNADARALVEMMYPSGDKIEFFADQKSSFGWDDYQEQSII